MHHNYHLLDFQETLNYCNGILTYTIVEAETNKSKLICQNDINVCVAMHIGNTLVNTCVMPIENRLFIH